jgi:transcriptional regulator with XRE-family HTH domain
MDQAAVPLPAGFWSAPAVASALGSCDFATLLEEIRRAHGWKQAELAGALGYSQSWVSKVLRGSQALTVDQAREISRRLGVPVHLLRFGDPGGEDPAKRREFGTALALAFVPLPRPTQLDEGTAPALTAITGAQRRLDSTTSARELAQGVAAHVQMTQRILARTRRSPLAGGVAAALSEAAGLAAWLHADMCDIGTARTYYRLAVDGARQAGHELLAGYMLGSLAAFEIDTGDPLIGLTLVARARQQIGRAAHPTPRAWLASIEALGHATARKDGTAASGALRRAAREIGNGAVLPPPPWPWLFPFDRPKLAGYRALVAVRLQWPADALAAFAESLTAVQPAPKQRAIIMLEVATAACQDGTRRRDTARIGEAFQLAGGALSVGTAYSSERVIQRARAFRRDYTGPMTTQVRELDHQLQSTLP